MAPGGPSSTPAFPQTSKERLLPRPAATGTTTLCSTRRLRGTRGGSRPQPERGFSGEAGHGPREGFGDCRWRLGGAGKKRDRFTREPAYHYLLRREFGEYGTKIRALNDRGDESPEGELTDGILDQLAKFERAKIAERTRRVKLQKARQGKVLAGPRPNFGFQYNANRDNYVVDEEQMRVIERIFREVGAEGRTMYAVKAALDREGVSPPSRGRYWSLKYIRDRINDDVYRPYTFEEVSALVSSEVAARLDPAESYVVLWFNRRRHETRHVAESRA